MKVTCITFDQETMYISATNHKEQMAILSLGYVILFTIKQLFGALTSRENAKRLTPLDYLVFLSIICHTVESVLIIM